MLTRERFASLLEKYVSDTILPEERSEFFLAVSSGAYDDILAQHIDTNLKENTATGANLPPHRSAEILHKILSSEKQNAVLLPVISIKAKIIRWSAAAAVVAALLVGGYIFNNKRTNQTTSTIAFSADMKKEINNSGQPLKIQMEDASTITLQPGSSIHYPTHFLADKREIFLEGEAFFEVSKNAKRPFFVYNKNIVTHVLGTSFNVKANEQTKQVEVSVRTGRVEVYESSTTGKNNVARYNNGVILLPNQKVVYNEEVKQFVPSLVERPLPVNTEINETNITAENTLYEETALKTVLPSLEKTYGIEIVVENEDLYKCLFTGDISQQDLYTRLDIVCQATGAAYEIKGTKILIKGKGCGTSILIN